QVGAHGVGDLVAAAVADGDVDLEPDDVGRGGLGRARLRGGRLGQQVEAAHDSQAPPAALRQAGDRVLDDGEQRLELLGGALEVVGREHPQRDDLDPQVLAPAEELADLV